MVEQCLGQNAARRVVRTQKKYIQWFDIGHFKLSKLTAFANVLRGQLAGLPLATVLGQVSQYGIHAVVLGPIDQMTTTALLRNEIGMHQLFQVK
jgi:hypothetical protein